MERYNTIDNKNKREIVLLKGFPCIWGKCTFCDYIHDNSTSEDDINELNFEVLSNITGKYKVLEVINSGSCFELPKKTLERIREIVKEKAIEKLFLESHWCYKNRLNEMREFFQVPIIFKIGVETFDYEFRNNFLNKNARFKDEKELKQYFDSPCMLFGIKGQTEEMIKRDMDIVLSNFHYATINIFIENSTNLKRDESLIKWFMKEYKFLLEDERIEVLYNNTDFGVGE